MYNAIIEPIASLLGKVLDVLFVGINAIGLGNIAIAIILFTLLVKLLMLPLTAKQSKMMKLNSIIGPEVRAIQNKYKDKKGDQNAMLKMQEETKAVYAKYGTSQMGGCVQMLIQFPILLALYRVFQRIPMYVTSLKALFINILGDGGNGIMSAADYSDFMSNTFNTGTLAKIDWSNVNDAVVAMNSFTTEQWNLLKEHFTSYASVIADNQTKITEMNTFLGINVSQVPTLALNIAILIPILSGVTQYISVRVSQGKSNQDDSDNPAAASSVFAAASLDAPALPVDVFALFPHPVNIVAPNAIHITILTNFLFISKTSHSFFRFGFVANHGLIITVRGFYEYRIKFELSIIFY
mgnify:CR=1 FL=1